MGLFSTLESVLEDQVVAETQVIPQLEHFIKDCENSEQIQVRLNQLLEVSGALTKHVSKRGNEYAVMHPITKERSITLKKHKKEIILVK
ncbi:hypothetical protein KUA24_12 [Vibrio phage HNL01]|nr:hypothetical protein KUA24_12 [Vibrio phage HNL01]